MVVQSAFASEETHHDTNSAHDVHSTTDHSNEHVGETHAEAGGEHHEAGGEHHEAAGSSYHPPSPYLVSVTGKPINNDALFSTDTIHLNTLIATWMAMIFIVVLSFMATRKLAKKPDTKQVFFESIVDFANWVVSSQVAKDTYRYVPLIGTIFMFIAVSNWMGLLPWRTLELLGTPHGFEIASPTNDLNTNGAIALISVASYWFFGIRKKGMGHFKHYFQPMWFMFPLNIMEDFSRPLSLTFRLFGNIIGGEIVMGIIIFLTSSLVVTSIVVMPMMIMEVLVGFIQAFIFSILTASYIGAVVAEHH